MKQGISIERTYDLHDRLIVRILKRRGRLTLEEVSDLLRLEGGGEWSGWYAVLLNCTEGTIGGNGLYDSDDPKGDAVDLYEINEGDDCPICGKFIPPFQYCPSCGAKWSDADQNVETLLASMMEETRRMIAASSKEDGRVAWYWSFIGSLDMARQLGLITEERRQELYEGDETMNTKAIRQLADVTLDKYRSSIPRKAFEEFVKDIITGENRATAFRYEASPICRASFPSTLDEDGARCTVEVTVYRLNAVAVTAFLLDGPETLLRHIGLDERDTYTTKHEIDDLVTVVLITREEAPAWQH